MGTAHLVLALLVVHYIAAQRADEPGEGEGAQSNIINGVESYAGEFPFMVRLVGAEFMDTMCGGVLLTKKLVLTAAHCIVEKGRTIPVDKFKLVVGDFKTSDQNEENEKVVEPMRVMVREDYYMTRAGAPVNDLAMIVLKEEVTLKDEAVETIAMTATDAPYKEGTAVTVMGWGTDVADGDNYNTAEKMQKLEQKVTNKENCIKFWTERAKKMGMADDIPSGDGMFCTIDPEGQGLTFKGDSGSPIIKETARVGKDLVELIGLVSWGTENPTEVVDEVGVDLYYYKDWIEAAKKRADEESWLEIQAGASDGPVMVKNKNGKMTTICNDDVGENEVNAICREQGYKMGALASVWDYQRRGRGRKNKEAELPPFGYTKLSCKEDAKNVMTDCKMDEYKDATAPCFNGQQLAVKCANEAWEFKVSYMAINTISYKGTEFVRGRVSCEVKAQKYGKDLDMKNQVQVGLVTRGEGNLDTVESDMKYRKKTNLYVGKFTKTDEIKANACFACIAYLPGQKFYTVGKYGPDTCPKNSDAVYRKWVEEQNLQT